ncbi:MAG TPA: error-prone DNA polymerase [Steroidobacteraceae bacterium]|nr:error-prone DNA polymerase [Steroidobacteraceae bacterium]
MSRSAEASPPAAIGYAELHALSNFSFLRGASHPAELVERAHALGYRALALTDECSLAGVVRAHEALGDLSRREPAAEARSRRTPGTAESFQLIIGAEFHTACGLTLVLLAPSQRAYGQICQLITLGRRRSPKGEYRLLRADFESGLTDCLALWVPSVDAEGAQAAWLREFFPGRGWVAAQLHRGPDDARRLAQTLELARAAGLPAVAAGDVHMHVRARRRLQDALTAIRHGCTLDAAGWALYPNGERHLRSLRQLAALYPPALLAETVAIAERCHFSLATLHYEYPAELVPEGRSASEHLAALTEQGVTRRWPLGVPPAVRATIERELALIAELRYEHFFLTVEDIVRYARERGILCQGRGSAANSAVCYALGITEIDPARMHLLFERFISRERNEPPDIDVDFEHERREEVMQYIYRKYGRERAALAATVICYRTRSAIRDLARALGAQPTDISRLTRLHLWSERPADIQRQAAARELPLSRARLALLARLVRELVGFPRHLSQHVGGFVISGEPLATLVPIENAAMAERTVIQWDKDDLESLGLLKVDVLALGMLTALRRCFALLQRHCGRRLTLADIPPKDTATFDMICRGETVGVFQIESRAQMSMLPRLQPRSFYDLVIEVAIVRPGPIQGDMVHPYLQRRMHPTSVHYPSKQLEAVLERTLGVPIFQEQVMQIAVVAAGFTPGEADGLRRAMAAWKRRGGLTPYRERLLSGMAANGYAPQFAEQIYKQILGFGEYGFPECVAGDTRIVDADCGRWLRIDEIYCGKATITHTFACAEDLKLCKRRVMAVIASGARPVWRLRTALGHSIDASAEHPFLTPGGWRTLAQLRIEDHVAAARSPRRAESAIDWDRVVSIEPLGNQPTYDLQIEGNHNFLANNLIVHNSHAASFALLTYVSSWLKCHEPAAFAAALINSQPMGFYAPAQLTQEARRSGIGVLPVDVTVSEWDCTLEAPPRAPPAPPAADAPARTDQPALRLGLRLVRGLVQADGERIVAARAAGPFAAIDELAVRAQLSQRALQSLAAAGALAALSRHRHEASWRALGVERLPGLLQGLSADEPPLELPAPTEGQQILADYRHLGLTTGRHPLALLRGRLARCGFSSSVDLRGLADGSRVRVGGLVTHMQQPATASGVVFASLEDEGGILNIILWPDVFATQRRCALAASLLVVDGTLQRRDRVAHVIAQRLHDRSAWLGGLQRSSRDFH